jgi:hypothetical protein
MADYNSPKRANELTEAPDITNESLFLIADPITGLLHKVKKGDLDFGTVRSFSEEFVIADWVVSGDYYTLDFEHSLNTTTPVIQVSEDDSIKTSVISEVIDADTVRLFVPLNPDLRFDGFISILKSDL